MNTFRRFIIACTIIWMMTILFPLKAFAQVSYTLTQISGHNSSTDCWMAINGNVYDVTEYLTDHDRMLDIRPWCGTDATNDYNTKNGRNQPHTVQADTILNQYLIGTLETSEQSQSTSPITDINKLVSTAPKTNPYNVVVPLLITLVLYGVTLKFLTRKKHSFIWNTVLLLGLIPSFGFGVLMVLVKQFPSLRPLTNFPILYSHVELSIVFGTVCILHFLLRFTIYLAQAKSQQT